ncbi:thioredoxin family protein [Corallococcus macrosporus]|uniref:thioredoxin family protein n=1 Tax=Corallococcus macrosporus TaxID=35 RepID=UPI003241D32A
MNVTAANLKQTVGSPGIVVLDFRAAGCAPCRAFAPVFEAAAAVHPDVTWGKVDTQAESALAGALGIRSIPTVAVFRDGIPVFAQPGVRPASALEEVLAQVRALDMDAVRQEASRHAPAMRGQEGA